MSIKNFVSVKEYRRNIAIKLLSEEGWSQQKIADFLDIFQLAVSHWATQVCNDPAHGLNDKPHPGAQPKLSEEKLMASLAMLFELGPVAFGYNDERWNVKRITQAVKELTGVGYHPSRIRVLLHEYGYSPQRPALIASQRDENAIQEWAQNEWPEIKKAEEESRYLIFVDESNFHLMPLVLRSWAVTGVTPILDHLLSHDKLSLIGSVDTDGKTLYYEHVGNITSQEIIEFLKQLKRGYKGEKLLVVWDGAPVHRSKIVKELLAEQDGLIWLERLPDYAPEFNPQEFVWSWQKRQLANKSCKALWEVKEIVKVAYQELSKLPELVKGIINGSPVMTFQ